MIPRPTMSQTKREKISTSWYRFVGPGGIAGVRGGWSAPYPWTVYFRDRRGVPVAPTARAGQELPMPSYALAAKMARAHCDRPL